MNTTDLPLQRAERRFLAFLCFTLVLLQVLDLHSSLRAEGAGRSETNPLILWGIAYVGFAPAVIVCKAAALALIGAYYLIVRNFKRMLWQSVSLVPVCATYIAVVFNNYS